MRLLARSELSSLLSPASDTCVSIYLPTHRTGDVEQDAIRLRNLLRVASDKLEAAGLRAPDAARVLEPAKSLVADTLFWHHQADGLAMFLSAGQFAYYVLPYTFEERVVVSSRFHVSPVLPLFSGDGLYYVLALSQNYVRLVQCTRDGGREVTPDSVPESLADALQYDEFSEETQYRAGGPAGGPSGRSPMFHGHGEGKDIAKDNIIRFLREVDHGLHDTLVGETAPLILAGVEYMRALYREANTYPHLLSEGIDGNPEGMSASALQRAAKDKVEPHFAAERQKALRRYGEGIPLGLTRDSVDEVLLAASDGRVSVLFTALGAQRWGLFCREERRVEVHGEAREGDVDLIDLAVVRSLVTGANVYASSPEMVPGKASVAALLRY